MENQLTASNEKSLLFDVQMFAHAQRVGNMLASSTMVPEHFRNNIGNCVIALNYAHRVGIDPFMALQKMYIIHGKPAVETQLQIALFNNAGKYSPLKFRITGEGDKKTCVAYAKEKSSGEVIEGPPVSIEMAKAEGWYGKTGSKWKTLPELMLRYRAAAFFIRLYAPETTLGMHTTEELLDTNDVIDITPVKNMKKEIVENANSEVIDIDMPKKAPQKKTKPVQPPDTATDDTNTVTDELTEEEKAEIIAEEARLAEADGPGF